jgi:uncharacterized protein
MTQPAKAQEPSMEEILASIRRIIADDDASKAAQRPAEPPKPAMQPMPAPHPVEEPAIDRGSLEEPASDILDLTESMAAPSFARPEPAPMPSPVSLPPAPAPQFRKIDGESDVGFDEAAQKPPAPNPAPAPVQQAESDRLISTATSAAVDSAFNALAQTVLAQNARTLEDLVREMLRPMLKSWLDDNLPGLVERLVRAEIERVARGR